MFFNSFIILFGILTISEHVFGRCTLENDLYLCKKFNNDDLTRTSWSKYNNIELRRGNFDCLPEAFFAAVTRLLINRGAYKTLACNGPVKVTELSIANVTLANVSNNYLQHFTEVENLTLVLNGIELLPKFLCSLKNLKNLNIHLNNFTELSFGVLSCLKHLESLDLSFNGITNTTFQSHIKLNQLNLTYNAFEEARFNVPQIKKVAVSSNVNVVDQCRKETRINFHKIEFS